MSRTCLILELIFIIGISACQGSPTLVNNNQRIDTTKSFKISNYWVTSKPDFELISILDSSKDTLRFITCAEYVYSPFGILDKKSDLKNSLLKNIDVIDRIDTMDNGVFEFQIIKSKSSRLILFFDDDPEATKHSSIFKGVINDKEFDFAKGIKIGMDKDRFISTFFDNFPVQLLAKYDYFVFESCVLDIKHTYIFKENKLQSIEFKTNSYWTVDY